MKPYFLSKMTNQQGSRGQSLVELALSMTVILTLLAGAVDFSLALFAYVSMRDAAQEGALYGSIEPEDETGIKLRVIAAASDVIAVTEDDITVSYSSDANKCEGLTDGSPNTLTITLTHPHQVSMPLVGAFMGSQHLTLSAGVTNTILSPVCP